MTSIANTVEADERNEFGLPPISVTAHEKANQHTEIDNSNRKNDALPWVAISWLLSGIAVGGMLINAITTPQMVDAKVSAGVAEAKSAMAQQAADAKATAQTAKEHARVALDKVEQTQVQLGANGLVQPSTH